METPLYHQAHVNSAIASDAFDGALKAGFFGNSLALDLTLFHGILYSADKLMPVPIPPDDSDHHSDNEQSYRNPSHHKCSFRKV